MIELRNLTRKYGNRMAVDSLSFTAGDGKIYGFLGPNGAGKSTTMNMITGYLAPSSGSVLIDGTDIQRETTVVQKRIGYLPEVPPVYGDMTIFEYLKYAAALKGIPCKSRKYSIEEIMQKTGLSQMRHRLICNLSKGYRQRVGLAQAIIHDPKNIILDEPTSGLDPQQQKEIFDLIRSLKEGHTIIISSHILSEISQICDQLLIIQNGRLVANDSAEHLTAAMSFVQQLTLTVPADIDTLKTALKTVPGIKDIVLSQVPDEAGNIYLIHSDVSQDLRPFIANALLQMKIPIFELTKSRKSLEDIFLELTKENPL